jgi:hypothetical protein
MKTSKKSSAIKTVVRTALTIYDAYKLLSPSRKAPSREIKDLKGVKSEWSARLLNAPRVTGTRAFAASSVAQDQNVVGVGIGEKVVDGAPTGRMAIKFFVRVKYPESALTQKDLLPKDVDGFPVDVEESGIFRKHSPPMPNPKLKIRPAQPGCSIGYRDPANKFVMAGSFGAVVKKGGGIYILSNNHVLADENRLPTGAPIFQPGLLDGGNTSTDQIAKLSDFVTLTSAGPNKVDCAIAKALSDGLVSKDILHIGAPTGDGAAALDMIVHKFGRTTSYTVGRITSLDTDVTVQYETGAFTFQEQIIITGIAGKSFSAAGDSGSLILERSTNTAVALLFAGSGSHTIANHIADVLKALNVTLA